jgi:L-fucose isomerase-like protein
MQQWINDWARRGMRMAVQEAKRLVAQDVCAVIFNIPVFAFPNLSVIAADVLQKPIAVLSPGEPGLPGMGGMLAAGGALTMQVLQLIAGVPALFMDLRHYDARRKLWTLCNCGGMAPFYARRAQHEAANLQHVELVPVIPKYGGTGCHARYSGCAGPLTCARIMHDAHGMALLLCHADAVAGTKALLQQSCPSWPHLFVKLQADHTVVLDALHANHIHAMAGEWREAVALFAAMTGVRLTQL